MASIGNGRLAKDKAIGDSHELAGHIRETGRGFENGHGSSTAVGMSLSSAQGLEPCNGMEFGSKEEAFTFYKEYAKSVGFAAIIKASRRSRISGKFIDAKFICTRYGTKKEDGSSEAFQPPLTAEASMAVAVKRKRGRKSRSWSKTDCKASMHVKRRQPDGRWTVHSFVKEHNHDIFPDQACQLRGHRNLDLGNDDVDALHAVRARTKHMYASISRQSGGCKEHASQKENVRNKLSGSRNLALDVRDAQLMLEHFICMQDENPNFFYAIDLNQEQRLSNVLWVDAKGRIDYESFNDVVFFNTMSINNEYKLPLAPFIGVNHHFQSLLFGCALLADNTKATYVWVMRAWHRAMRGHAPKLILSDQDNSLKEAIAEVFPNSHHCFCLWHILSKIPEKLSYKIRQHENFMGKFRKCVFMSWTGEQFEKRWWKMVERYNLHNDAWFQALYEDRQRWIPTFMRDKFFAGMSGAQCSGINSVFDKYIQRKTTLREFVEHYKEIMQDKFEEEAKADFERWHKQPVLKSPSPFGKQMANLYTQAIFKKFQVEVLGVVACHPRIECEDGETKTFKVQDFEEDCDFLVLWNGNTSYLSCSCHLFEYDGFLCRHALIVMQMSGVHNIPSQYILKRWTKHAKNGQTMREHLDFVHSGAERYNNLCCRGLKLGDEGSLSVESYTVAIQALEEALRQCELVNTSVKNAVDPTSLSANGPHNFDKSSEANSANKNGASRKEHVYQELDAINVRMDNGRQQMGEVHLSASGCEDHYTSPHSLHGLG